MSHLFRNVHQTTNYAKFRPRYPDALYQYLLQLLKCEPTVAVDVGCGTGQATFELAKFFDRVVGIDPSAEQVCQANETSPKVSFQVNDSVSGLMEFEDSSVACITVAQAAHWFDMPHFYSQAKRVLKPGGLLAMWTYGLMDFHQKNSALLQRVVNEEFYEDLLGSYWDSRREFVEQKYATLPRLDEPGYETFLEMDKFHIDMESTADELVGFLHSWSAYASYCQTNGIVPGSAADPILSIKQALEKDGIREIKGTWPVSILWTRKA